MILWPIGLGRYARHALGIILGETYQEPQASSSERQASSFELKKRFDLYRIFLYKVNAPVFMFRRR